MLHKEKLKDLLHKSDLTKRDKLLIILAVVDVFVAGKYNGLVQLRNRCDNSWAQVDVQLRRRYDLIPNLVETVKGYATHEKETFQKVTEATPASAWQS